ncbi:nitroreductase family protein [Paenirhodobacter sp.]|uniref:nitroreductase family protein n=1 Tax=Paenirhodobacter sp. TaxID=1965326 RepID=UPI003B3E3049
MPPPGARYAEEPRGDLPWNPVLASILGHRSVRAFLPDPVGEEELAQVIAAASSAPSSANLQAWSVVAVMEPGAKPRLGQTAVLHRERYGVVEEPRAVAPFPSGAGACLRGLERSGDRATRHGRGAEGARQALERLGFPQK